MLPQTVPAITRSCPFVSVSFSCTECLNLVFSFQDGGMTIYWDIYPIQIGQNVTANSKGGYAEENWWLYNA